MRSASASRLDQATRPFAAEDSVTTWRLLIALLLAIAAVHAITVFLAAWPLKLGGAVVLGLLNVRLFIFVHDTLHGAIFRRSRTGKLLMAAAGHYLLSPPSYWRFAHNRHHARNGEVVGSYIGEFPLVDTDRWRTMSSRDRFAYKSARSPLNLALAYFTIFVSTHCLYGLVLDPRRHRAAALTLLFHFGGLAWMSQSGGWQVAVFNGFLPVLLACTAGGVLFYFQHNAPGVRYRGRGSRDLTSAALESSTMLEMSPVMHWFTGNIGYHHIHHLNPHIPFYRLPEAMACVPALQSPVRLTWADFWKCRDLSLWNPATQQMVGYRDAEPR